MVKNSFRRAPVKPVMDSHQPQATQIEASELFDEQWYLTQYPDVAEHPIWHQKPALHYARFGAEENRHPGPRFDTVWYLTQYPDVKASGMNPLLHYLQHGHREGRRPSPDGPERELASAVERRLPPPSPQASSMEQGDVALINESGLFDREWYLSEYQDVASHGVDPVVHYVQKGAKELREPGPAFDTAFYFAQCPDASREGVNPLVHYLRVGHHQGCRPRPELTIAPWWQEVEPAEPVAFDMAATLERLKVARHVPAVIIPVYNAVDAVADCLASLQAHTRMACRIIVIDDASPDPAVAQLLDGYRDVWPFECYRNEHNLGFTRTVNRGLQLAGRADAVLLNSDTCVTPSWLGRLRLAAYSQARVGTVTPFSNNAGAFSAPEPGTNELPDGLALEAFGRAIAQGALHRYPQVPTGNGFCLYIRRDCLDDMGELDAEAFPRGYGEENDFCMRAGKQGWTHLIDDSSYIHHVRSASFGSEKTALMEQGRQVIDKRHPEYGKQVQKAFAAPGLQEARRRVATLTEAAQGAGRGVKPRILYVLATRTGGTPQTNQDLMQALDDRIECFVLRCNSRVMTLLHFAEGVYTQVERHVLSEPLQAFPHRSAEYDAVAAEWLVRYAIELVHVRHIAWHSLGLIEAARALAVPTVFSFHDYYSVCPSIKLLDDQQQFCGGRCTATRGDCGHELWAEGSLPPLKHAAIKTWQREFNDVLAQCDAFVTTTPSARANLQAVYPALKQRDFRVLPHGRDFPRMAQLASAPSGKEPLRIVFPGNISRAKGGETILELARRAPELGLEIHILGKASSDLALPDWVNCHGGYMRDEFFDKIAAIRPHVGAVLSIWPETFCHTLTELWATGVPVIGFDIGAVGDRLRESNAGWLAPSMTAEGVLTVLEEARQAETWQQKLQAVQHWQQTKGTSQSCQVMAEAYLTLYQHVWHRPFKALSSGLIAFES